MSGHHAERDGYILAAESRTLISPKR